MSKEDASSGANTEDVLDDQEYSIPKLKELPTLSSILKASTEGVPVLQMTETQSEIAFTATSTNYTVSGYMLRHVILRNISSQIQTAMKNLKCGRPTVLAAKTLVAVGTFHGLVLVFDVHQKIKWCFGTTQFGARCGSVSALDFSPSGTHLLAGHDRGTLNLWDLHLGRMTLSIGSDQLPNSAILHIKYTDSDSVALSSDSGGSVFKLSFKKIMGLKKCEVRCLFSGSRGEVVTFEPLLMRKDLADRPVNACTLVALASFTKVIVLCIEPYVKVWFTFPLVENPALNPVLYWHFAAVQNSTSPIDPILSFGRDKTIYLYYVRVESMDKIRFNPIRRIDVVYSFQNFCWMSSTTIAVLDIHECLHLLSVKSEEELDSLDLGSVELVYGTPYFKGIATGGNVSKAMISIGNRVCYNTMIPSGNQIILLGQNSIHVVSVRSWFERIDYFTKRKLHHQALDMAQSLYEGKGKLIHDATRAKENTKLLIVEKVKAIIVNYLDQILTNNDREGSSKDYLAHTIKAIINYCFVFGLKEILFTEVYQHFTRSPITLDVFLCALEPYILDNKLHDIPPEISNGIIKHYSEKEHFDILENIILCISPSSLNVSQILFLCRKHKLFCAFIYLCSRTMHNYVMPLEELLLLLQMKMKEEKKMDEKTIQLGNQLLVYISCCLSGQAYPWGDNDVSEAVHIKNKIYFFLIRLYSSLPDDETLYPNMKILLHFDTREFLNVLSLAFTIPSINKWDDKQRQTIIDILIEIMVARPEFKPSQIGALFVFLARQLADSKTQIRISNNLFEQIIEYLINPDDDNRVEERQHTLLELHKAGQLSSIDPSRLLKLADKAKFYQVCEKLYEETRQFDKILSCYIYDMSRNYLVFSFIYQIFDEEEYTLEEKQLLKTKVIEELNVIANISINKTSEMIFKYFLQDLEIIVDSKLKPHFLYKVLHKLSFYKEECSSSRGSNEFKHFPSCAIEKFVELTCQFEPHLLKNVLENNPGYKKEKALQICYKYNLTDAIIYLLENSGDLYEAFKVLYKELHNKMLCVFDIILQQKELDNNDVWKDFKKKFLAAIKFCQRNSEDISESEKENLWYSLLDILLIPQKEMKAYLTQGHLSSIKDAIRELLQNMSGHLPLTSILRQILQNPVCTSGTFSEIRSLVMSMLESCAYETLLLNTCVTIHCTDLYHMLNKLSRESRKAISSQFSQCAKCSRPFVSSSAGSVLFHCGHMFHPGCMPPEHFQHNRHLKETMREQPGCPVCGPNRARRNHKQSPHPSKASLRQISSTHIQGSRMRSGSALTL